MYCGYDADPIFPSLTQSLEFDPAYLVIYNERKVLHVNTTWMSELTTPYLEPVQSQEGNERNHPFSRGHLVPLRTKAEVAAKLNLTDAYLVEIPLKSANGVVKCVPSGEVWSGG